MDLSIQSKDYATNNFLQWFVNEQVEEEATVEEIIRKLEMIGDNKGGLYMLDRELGLEPLQVIRDLNYLHSKIPFPEEDFLF